MTSILKVSTIQDPTNSNTAISINSAGGVSFGGGVTLPAGVGGKILQVANSESTTQVSTAAVMTYIEIQNLTLTTIGTNSKFFVIGYSHAYGVTAPARANLNFSSTIGGTTTALTASIAGLDAWGTAANPGAILCRSITAPITASAGTSITFSLLGATYDSTVTFNYSGYNHQSSLTVMEIAQ